MLAQPVSEHSYSTQDDVWAKAQKAGVEFEGVLLNMVLGAVERSFSELPGAKLHEQTEAYSGFAMQALTSGLARSGGIGLGRFISDSLIKTVRLGSPGQGAPKEKTHVSTPVRQVTQEF